LGAGVDIRFLRGEPSAQEPRLLQGPEKLVALGERMKLVHYRLAGAYIIEQKAVVTGPKDVSSAAKVIKTFAAEFDKPKIKFGYLKNQRLETPEILVLADLPSIEVMRGRLLGVLEGPATKLVTLLNTPATQLARVLKGRQEKLEKQEQQDKPEKPEKPAAAAPA